MRREHTGFTLVEVIVALAIGAVVLVSARALLDGLASHARVTVRMMHTIDDQVNAERMARQIVGNAALAPGQAASFVGTPTEATFESWCPSARGTLEQCHVRLSLVSTGETPTVVLSPSTGQPVTLLSGRKAQLRYLADPADGGHWEDQWKSIQTPPLALAAGAGGHSLFLRIGERR